MDPSDRPDPSVAPRETRSTCPYCGVGCGVLIATEGAGAQARITGVRGDPLHPANEGRLCSKGAALHLTAEPLVQQQARIAAPELRTARDRARQVTDWDTALEHVADRFAACIAEHGPDSVAFYLSGQLLTEDYYVFNKLAKGLVGTNNVDTNSRLCMSSAVAGYKRTLGADAPPSAYADLDHAECLFIAGANPAWAHPVLFRRIEAARQARPSMKVVVVDPRRTDTAGFADLHLPILPGTDVALFNAMLHHVLWEGWARRDWIDAHTSGFEALRDAVRECTPRWAAGVCGVPVEAIEQAAQWFARSPATLSLYCQGLNQSAHGTDKNAALINLHLATAQIGRPGAGPFSLTGQPNAMGGREVGGMANLLSGHRDLADPEHRAEVAALWGVDSVPAEPGLTAVAMFDAIKAGRVKMVWIACTNPAQSLPNQAQVHAALREAQFVVVQDAYAGTATTPYADVLLPATTWGEKDGTVTNSERRISRVRPALPAFGQSRHDWAIAIDFARRLERRLRPDRPTLFPWDDAEGVWNEHRATTVGRDLDIGGLSYALLEAKGPQQWPFPAGAAEGRLRLYEDGVFPTADGRARFAAVTYRAVAEPVDARFPVRLTTGRLRDQWHGMSRTGLIGRLFAHVPEPAVELHPDELLRRGWRDGDLVRVASRRGAQILPVQGSDALRPGTAFVAMHWGPEFVSGRDGAGPTLGVNALTLPALDPHSRQPELKHCAVRIDAVQLPGRLVVAGLLPAGRAVAVRQALTPWLSRADFGSCVPFAGPDGEGVLLRLADLEAIDDAALDAIQASFEVPADALLRYDDPRRGTSRRLWVADGRLRFVMLAGDASPEAWLRDFLARGAPVAALGRQLLMASSQPPAGYLPRGRTVCSCLGVASTRIEAVLDTAAGSDPERLETVQRALSCGTQCGSCLPELRRMVAARPPADLPAGCRAG